MSKCKTCKHDGNQMLYPSGCTGCGVVDGEYANYQPMTTNERITESEITGFIELLIEDGYEGGACMKTLKKLIASHKAKESIDGLLSECLGILRENNWRGDLQENIADKLDELNTHTKEEDGL